MYGTIFTTHLHMFARRCTNVLAALLVCRIEDGVHWHLVNVSSTSYIAAAIYDHVSPPTIFHTVTVTWSDPHHACAAQLLSAFWSSGVQYIPRPSWQYIIPWFPSITRCEVLGPCMTTASLIKDSNMFTRADKLPHVWVDLEIFGDWGMVMWLKYCQFQTSSSSSSSTPQSLSSTPPHNSSIDSGSDSKYHSFSSVCLYYGFIFLLPTDICRPNHVLVISLDSQHWHNVTHHDLSTRILSLPQSSYVTNIGLCLFLWKLWYCQREKETTSVSASGATQVFLL